MATENLGKTITLPIATTALNKQYRFVTVDSAGRAALAADGGDAIGVLQDDAATLDYATCVMVGNGITKVMAGAATTLGGYVASDSTGRAVDPATGDRILGEFLEAATAAGDIVSILFQKYPHVAA